MSIFFLGGIPKVRGERNGKCQVGSQCMVTVKVPGAEPTPKPPH